MSNIVDLYTQSELALAAYANLTAGTPSVDELKRDAVGMSQSQAERFAECWLVLDQYTHSELIPILDEFNQPTGEYTTSSNGLSVTVFQRVGTNEKYVAVRGTEFSLSDFTADGGVFLHGVPSL